MFDFINENVPEKLKTMFVINRSIHSQESQSSMVFHIPKVKTSRFGLNTLHYDGAILWNKFYHALLYKEPNLTKAKLKNTFNTFPAHQCLIYFHLIFVYFVFINSTAAKIKLSK